MWNDFLNLPQTAQIAFVGAVGFFGSFAGILLLIHGRRAWYAWRLEVWRRRNRHLWPDGESERQPESPERHRRRLNGLVEIHRGGRLQ